MQPLKQTNLNGVFAACHYKSCDTLKRQKEQKKRYMTSGAIAEPLYPETAWGHVETLLRHSSETLLMLHVSMTFKQQALQHAETTMLCNKD